MKLTQLFQTTRISRAFLITALALLGTGALQAQNFFTGAVGGINLATAGGGTTNGQRHWAIFALSGGVSVTETAEGANWTPGPGGDPRYNTRYGLNEVYGNIGAAGAGGVTLSATEINGSIYRNTGTYSNSGGTILAPWTNNNLDATLAAAVTDANNASLAAKNAAVTLAGGALSSSFGGTVVGGSYTASINATGSINASAAGTYVLRLTDIILSGATLTLNGNGTSNAVNYVINISRYLSLSNSAKIQLGNGLTAANVLFNVNDSTPANLQDVTLSGGAQLSGIILAPKRNVKLTGDSTVFGEVIGKSVSLSGSSNVFNPIIVSP